LTPTIALLLLFTSFRVSETNYMADAIYFHKLAIRKADVCEVKEE